MNTSEKKIQVPDGIYETPPDTPREIPYREEIEKIVADAVARHEAEHHTITSQGIKDDKGYVRRIRADMMEEIIAFVQQIKNREFGIGEPKAWIGGINLVIELLQKKRDAQ